MSNRYRGFWVFFQALSSIALGFLFYTIYLAIDVMTGHGLSAWFNGGVAWELKQIGVSSTTLDAILEGQNIVGVFTSILAICVFYISTRPRKMGGM